MAPAPSMLCQYFMFYTLLLINAIVKAVSVNHINVVFAIFLKVFVRVTAKLRKAFLFQVPNSFGIFLITFATLKNPFANPLKKVASLLPHGI